MTKSSSGLACCCCFPVFLFLLVMAFGIPSFLMFVGVSKLDHCPIEPKIPKWMICVASLIFLQVILESVRPFKDRSMRCFDCSIDCCSLLSLLLYISRLTLFGVTILGCVLVYSIFQFQNQCDSLLYFTAFIYCVLSLICSVIACVFWICCCCFLVVRGGYRIVNTDVYVNENEFVTVGKRPV
ncbi:Protein CBG25271 [Caenorhabditis briggsae]|uniref:Protein CBG25271 n=2 Tax=Caenorhabditis briggsae TaxID=6238 RepID=B6III9_CAEBR|nr:Protein CBG25271 [Caenorhabditis briggsae]ULU12404.1 hypothetical protein L3Y34_015595 [Caenorhabditis briggsae]CAR99719.1 Protein CBG25271 [Caenorhabditis briggsae]